MTWITTLWLAWWSTRSAYVMNQHNMVLAKGRWYRVAGKVTSARRLQKELQTGGGGSCEPVGWPFVRCRTSITGVSDSVLCKRDLIRRWCIVWKVAGHEWHSYPGLPRGAGSLAVAAIGWFQFMKCTWLFNFTIFFNFYSFFFSS